MARFGRHAFPPQVLVVGRCWCNGDRELDAADQARPTPELSAFNERWLLRDAVVRACRLTSSNRVVTVIDSDHRDCLYDALGGPPPGRLIEQPRDRGTTFATLLALPYILDRDPEATLLVLPADHFAYPDQTFLEYLDHATQLARRSQKAVSLMVESPPTDGGGAAHVRELPTRHTGILAAPAKVLWEMGQLYLPDLTRSLGILRGALRAALDHDVSPAEERAALEAVFWGAGTDGVVSDILLPVGDLEVIPLRGIIWHEPGRDGATRRSADHRRPRAAGEAGLMSPSGTWN